MPHDRGLRPWLARLVASGEASFMRWESASQRLLDRELTTGWPWLIRPGVRWLQFGEHPRRGDVELAARCAAHCRPASRVSFRSTFDDHDQVAAIESDQRLPAE
jgi:hypothetical protein